MLDFLKKEKQSLEQCKTNLDVAQKYSSMQMEKAKLKTKSFLSSPAGIGSAFAAGAVKGALSDVPVPPVSLVLGLASEFL